MSKDVNFGPPFDVDQLEFWFRISCYTEEEQVKQHFECSAPMELEQWRWLIGFMYNGLLPGLGEGEYLFQVGEGGQVEVSHAQETPAPTLGVPVAFIQRNLLQEVDGLRRVMEGFPTQEELDVFVRKALRFAFLDYLKRKVWSSHRIEPLFIDFDHSFEIKDEQKIEDAPVLVWDKAASIPHKLTLQRRTDGGINFISVMLGGCKSNNVISKALYEQVIAIVAEVDKEILGEVASISHQKIAKQLRITERFPSLMRSPRVPQKDLLNDSG